METRAQGATQLCSGTTYRSLVGQGATEYLVLLAVVLIVALVSVALLGFFPGMASDAQITQSQAYWQSAQPLAIEEWNARYNTNWILSIPTLVVKNNGAYPIRITKLLGGSGRSVSTFVCEDLSLCPVATTVYNISDYFYLTPGEKKTFGANGGLVGIYLDSSSTALWRLYAASSLCANSSSTPGTLIINNFGFEYIEYIDGQQITKKQIGKAVITRCMEPGTT